MDTEGILNYGEETANMFWAIFVKGAPNIYLFRKPFKI